MSIMKKVFIVGCLLVLPFLILSACYATRPPKPGPDFVWVESHTNPSGDFVPEHWKHVGPPARDKVWVPSHINPDGERVPGHWKNLKHPRPNAVWVPGHYGPKGHWVPGHWR